MIRTRAAYREWIRLRLLVPTPRQRWLEYHEPDEPCPALGAQPDDSPFPSNSLLDSVITSACNTVTRRCRMLDAIHYTEIAIPSQTAGGPYMLRLDALPGFSDGQAVNIRRAYWITTGDTDYQRLEPIFLGQQDTDQSNWMNDGPATPQQIAVEGMSIYLLPGSDTGGTLRLTVGAGLLAPMSDDEGYDGIPEAYDDAVNYLALVELSMIPSGDKEMQARAAAFSPFAQAGLAEIDAWSDNLALDGRDPHMSWTSPGVIRYSRTN